MDSRSFAGKTVVIVSASWPLTSGWIQSDGGRNIHIGAACARAFTEYGADVHVIDHDQQALDGLRHEGLGGPDRALRVFQADCRSFEALSAVAAKVGPVHALVNCHSYPQPLTLAAATPLEISNAIAWDLLGPLMSTKAFLKNLEETGDGAIVHVGSIDGVLGNPGIPLYSMCKGGLISLTHVMGDEFAPKNIRVNYVARGMTVDRGAPEIPTYRPLVVQTPLGRPAYPEEVADAVCFLASSHASYVNGTVLTVDGGRTAITPGTRQRPAGSSS